MEVTPKSVIDEHIATKLETIRRDPQTAIGHIRQERSVRNDYMGRAPFELLQNALDRAHCKVRLELCRETKSFSVANDGIPFSYQAAKSDTWSDFAAICAVNSSNKEIGKSIGNKGVGFRSIWEFCQQVQIVSRFADTDQYWGFQLNFPFKKDCLASWTDIRQAEEISQSIDALPQEKGIAPSFYFPKYLPDASPRENNFTTKITLQNLSEEKLNRLEELLSKLARSPLMFSGFASNPASHGCLIAEFDIAGQFYTVDLNVDECIYHLVQVDTSELVSSHNKHILETIDYNLTRKPQLFLAIHRSSADSDGVNVGSYHCYLPTELSTCCPLHIHADFYVDNSRKHIDFEGIEYNKKLVSLAADALIEHFDGKHSSYSISVICANLMPSGGKLKEILHSRLGGGERLASLIKNFLQRDDALSFEDLNALWNLIGHYSPERPHGGHQATYEKALVSYFTHFSSVELKLVSLIPQDSEKKPECVQIPRPAVDDSQAELFCLMGDNNVHPINAISVTVTPWRFPNKVGEKLKTVNVWRGYEESLTVLRAIIRAQKNHTEEEQRAGLLKAAATIDPVKNGIPGIRMIGNERHRSHAVLIPAHSPSGWAKAEECYFQSELLGKCIKNRGYFPVDDSRALAYLGGNYKLQLSFWGVWQVLPLKKGTKAGDMNWQLELSAGELKEQLSPSEILDCLAQCFELWQRGNFFDNNKSLLKAIHEDLSNTEWLDVTLGKDRLMASPANTFSLSSNQVLSHVPFISLEKIPPAHATLLKWLLVRDVEHEDNIGKLIRAVNCITSQLETSKPRSISREYRLIVGKLNSLRSGINGELSTFPRLVKEGSSIRLADSQEAVYFLTAEERRQIRGRLALPMLDVARDTAIEFIGKLPFIERFKSTYVIKPALESIPGEPGKIEYIMENVLPKLFAYADISDEISRDPDEDKIKERWGSIDIRSAAEGCDVIIDVQGPEGDQISSSSLENDRAVWMPALNSSKAATLILHPKFDWQNHHDLKALSKWMALEVFRMPELQQGFAMTLLGETDIEQNKIEDHKKNIASWLSKDDENELVTCIEAMLNKKLEKGAWRLLSTYQGAALSYSRLLQLLPHRLIPAIEHLNPYLNNAETLKSWLAENNTKLRHLVASIERVSFEWLTAETLIDDFDFDPERFVFAKLGVEHYDYKTLSESLTPALSELRSKTFEIELPSKKDYVAPTRFKVISNQNVNAGGSRLTQVRTQHQYAALSEAKAEIGNNVESQIAIQFAQQASSLTSENQQEFYKLVLCEYQRLLQEYRPEAEVSKQITNLIFSPKPSSAIEWYKFLHVGQMFDGCGYDVLGIDPENCQLLLVEVKHSSQNPPVIFLSENERMCIVRYSSDEFLVVNPLVSWRLYLSTLTGETVDLTTEVIQAINEHNESYGQILSCITATDWCLKLSSD